MNLGQAQLGDMRGINLGGYIPAPTPQRGLMQEALAALVSGAGEALANKSVTGLLTPDMGAQAVTNNVPLAGVENGVDKFNALQRWFTPRTPEQYNAGLMAKQQAGLLGAQTTRENTITPQLAAQMAAQTAATKQSISQASQLFGSRLDAANLANAQTGQAIATGALMQPWDVMLHQAQGQQAAGTVDSNIQAAINTARLGGFNADLAGVNADVARQTTAAQIQHPVLANLYLQEQAAATKAGAQFSNITSDVRLPKAQADFATQWVQQNHPELFSQPKTLEAFLTKVPQYVPGQLDEFQKALPNVYEQLRASHGLPPPQTTAESPVLQDGFATSPAERWLGLDQPNPVVEGQYGADLFDANGPMGILARAFSPTTPEMTPEQIQRAAETSAALKARGY